MQEGLFAPDVVHMSRSEGSVTRIKSMPYDTHPTKQSSSLPQVIPKRCVIRGDWVRMIAGMSIGHLLGMVYLNDTSMNPPMPDRNLND
jgi:hypothetical protein